MTVMAQVDMTKLVQVLDAAQLSMVLDSRD